MDTSPRTLKRVQNPRRAVRLTLKLCAAALSLGGQSRLAADLLPAGQFLESSAPSGTMSRFGNSYATAGSLAAPSATSNPQHYQAIVNFTNPNATPLTVGAAFRVNGSLMTQTYITTLAPNGYGTLSLSHDLSLPPGAHTVEVMTVASQSSTYYIQSPSINVTQYNTVDNQPSATVTGSSTDGYFSRTGATFATAQPLSSLITSNTPQQVQAAVGFANPNSTPLTVGASLRIDGILTNQNYFTTLPANGYGTINLTDIVALSPGSHSIEVATIAPQGGNYQIWSPSLALTQYNSIDGQPAVDVSESTLVTQLSRSGSSLVASVALTATENGPQQLQGLIGFANPNPNPLIVGATFRINGVESGQYSFTTLPASGYGTLNLLDVINMPAGSFIELVTLAPQGGNYTVLNPSMSTVRFNEISSVPESSSMVRWFLASVVVVHLSVSSKRGFRIW